MAENNVSNVAVPLEKGAKKAVTIGCMMLMLFIAASGAALAVLQGPILKSISEDAYANYFGMMGIMATLGLSIMTPIGGKLGDLFGRKAVVTIAGIICIASCLGMSVIRVAFPFMACRFLLGAAQGAFTATPYIIAREINEPKDVPKAMGLLASTVAVGGLAGSIISGIFSDMGLLPIAIGYPIIFLVIGIILIAKNYPNKKTEGKVKIDFVGMVLLAIVLAALSFGLNYAPSMGWTSPVVLVLFAVTIVALIVLVKYESGTEEPLVPVSLFKNSKFTVLLLVGFICYFYQQAMNSYAPLAVQDVIGGSATLSSSLQFPRMILTMVFPAIFGAWVGKKKGNSWKAMAISTALIAIAYIPLGFTSTGTPFILYMIMIGVTGIAESFRSVAVTPAAQATLEPSQMGIGTSFVTFVNSLASLVAAAVNAALYNSSVAKGDSVENIAAGINKVNLLAGGLAVVGFFVVILVVRKHQQEN
ncbi:MAG: MFS transporter [Roseburia sp.]